MEIIDQYKSEAVRFSRRRLARLFKRGQETRLQEGGVVMDNFGNRALALSLGSYRTEAGLVLTNPYLVLVHIIGDNPLPKTVRDIPGDYTLKILKGDLRLHRGVRATPDNLEFIVDTDASGVPYRYESILRRLVRARNFITLSTLGEELLNARPVKDLAATALSLQTSINNNSNL